MKIKKRAHVDFFIEIEVPYDYSPRQMINFAKKQALKMLKESNELIELENE